MGVPAFYRWLSEKYPKIVEDVLEERVKLIHGTTHRAPFDITRSNPSGLECDHLYIDMNGIIHPCSHPEVGPQPTCEEEMFENVCRYVDRLMRIIRPRQMLYLAIDGVAPRAKMNQQRARRFRSAQEARELADLEQHVRTELTEAGQDAPPPAEVWDSNVITPGTSFMLRLSEFLRFYVRKRISEDKAWQKIRVIFSDASLPGEGEHKIMSHIRLQRSQPGYNPNLVHVLHGLDADLIMLALATHEAHFYISREEVVFGRKSQETQDQRQLESGFRDAQSRLDEEAGSEAMTMLEENQHKPLHRISIPILRHYLANEFQSCLIPQQPNPNGGPPFGLPFTPSLERLIDDIVFLCFFVGNDFLPHLPSLDIRVGALDFLFNVYKRILPTLGDYITNHGGRVNLSHVDIILAEVGAIEDHVFAMKHENESQEKQRREQQKDRRKQLQKGQHPDDPAHATDQAQHKVRGRAAKILEKQNQQQSNNDTVALQRGHQAKEDNRHQQKASHRMKEENANAAEALKASLMGKSNTATRETTNGDDTGQSNHEANEEENGRNGYDDADAAAGKKHEPAKTKKAGNKRSKDEMEKTDQLGKPKSNSGDVDNDSDLFDTESLNENDEDDDEDDDENDDDAAPVVIQLDPEAAKRFKERVKTEKQNQLDEYSKNVEDKVRLHEAGWKDRYYSDKCKADDVEGGGGREHMFRSYVMGLCWVMKYYYDGVPSWTWYYPFHYAPFASDLKNIERFQKDCNSFDLNRPFNPVEQLMAVLPSDSAHAIPNAARWLMCDEESPIIDFYPKDVPVDPNGKAMPWLWVVLLPFIDEERLLAALSPTMTKWTKEELLCNARGLDDGYLYMHQRHQFGKKLIGMVLQGNKSASSAKERLSDAGSYGFAGFSGSIRPPLSNEVQPISEDSSESVKIPLPPAASKIDRPSHDNLFSDPIDSNEAICVAFSEPMKLSHKSILLAGAKPPPSPLTADDLRIRRPKLNRFGGTIANLGMSRSGGGQSYQTGYGSMNISSYERGLAQKTGRGYEMYQPGMRAWGAMEPVPKRQRGRNQDGLPSQSQFEAPNPFLSQSRGPVQRHQQGQRPPWQSNGAPGQQVPRWRPLPSQGSLPPPPPPPPPLPPPQQGYSQHQPRSQYDPTQQPVYHGNAPRPPYNQQHQQRHRPGQGFNFQSFNNQYPPVGQLARNNNRYVHQQQMHQQRTPPSRADGDTMSNLRAQLVSTLKQNRRPEQGQNNPRGR